jgi:SPP1 family predicted phage head-tail adaptor
MRAGNLDREITIECAVTTISDAGTPQETWGALVSLRAQLLQTSTDEYIRDAGATTERTAIFRTRYVAGVSVADRIVFDGVQYDIKQIKELGRRKGLELRAERKGA